MNSPDFVYTTYIKTTPEKLWAALINPEFTRLYWGPDNVSDWKNGSPWQHISHGDQSVKVTGTVIESVPPKRLVLSWIDPNNTTDESRVTFEIDVVGDMTRLSVVHGDFVPGSIMAAGVTAGWPRVLSSLKSFLETGQALDTWVDCDKPCGAVTQKGAA